MWNEHFGIGVVELLAAGVLTVAHDSGGPRSDILAADAQGRQIGFAASTPEE
jgi:alpha-1,2-mannosyltransferase